MVDALFKLEVTSFIPPMLENFHKLCKELVTTGDDIDGAEENWFLFNASNISEIMTDVEHNSQYFLLYGWGLYESNEELFESHKQIALNYHVVPNYDIYIPSQKLVINNYHLDPYCVTTKEDFEESDNFNEFIGFRIEKYFRNYPDMEKFINLFSKDNKKLTQNTSIPSYSLVNIANSYLCENQLKFSAWKCVRIY